MQGEQQQAQSDKDAAQVAPTAGLVTPEKPYAHQYQAGSQGSQVEGKQLDDERGADIGPKHGCQARCQGKQPAGGKAGDHQTGRGTALNGGGDGQSSE